MNELVLAYMKWEASLKGAGLEAAAPEATGCDPHGPEDYEIQVLDTYRASSSLFYLN